MCNCVGMARTFEEMEGLGKGIPVSNHHPACDDYQLISYSKITLGGDGCALIVEHSDVKVFIDAEVEAGASASDFCVEQIQLTVDQFNGLTEFEGF